MEIKLSLKRLKVLFAESAENETLPDASRQLAARQTVAVAHIERLETKINAVYTTLDKHVGELTGLVAELAKRLPQPESAPAAPPTVENTNEASEIVDDDAEAKAMAAKVLAETEAEAQTALTVTSQPAPAPVPVTPIRKTNAGKIAPATGDAS